MIGSLIIIVSFLRYKELRRFTFQLVALLSANDFVNQVADLIAPAPSEIVAMHHGAPVSSQCLAQATIDSYAELSAVGWATTISVTLYLTVTLRWPAHIVQAQLPKFVIGATAIPGVVAFTGLAIGAYGPSSGWCWVDPNGDRAWFMWVSYVIVWIAIVFNGYAYFTAHRALKNVINLPTASDMGDGAVVDRLTKVAKRIRGYPLILLLVWTFPTILRILGAFGVTNFTLIVITRFMVSSQGALNAIAWMQPRVRAAIRADLAKIFPSLRSETGLTTFVDPRKDSSAERSCCGCCALRRSEPEYRQAAAGSVSVNDTGSSQPPRFSDAIVRPPSAEPASPDDL